MDRFENQAGPDRVENQPNEIDAQIMGAGFAQIQNQMGRQENLLGQVLGLVQQADRDRMDYFQRFHDLVGEAKRWHDDVDKFAKMVIGIDFQENCLDQRIKNLLRTQELVNQGMENFQRRLSDLSRDQSGHAWVEEGNFEKVFQLIQGLKEKMTSAWSDLKKKGCLESVSQVNMSAQVGPSIFVQNVEESTEPKTPSSFLFDGEINMRERSASEQPQSWDTHATTQNGSHVNSQISSASAPHKNLRYDSIADSQILSSQSGQTRRTPVSMQIDTPVFCAETQVMTLGGPSERMTSTPVFPGGVPFPLSLSTIQKWQAENQERR
ncbi:MAG: hypothetical protein GY696_09690, partial [Gammaproteobacteria bacterium]|nr:hypothetical protein [Gammaproteobacteria bacterium]